MATSRVLQIESSEAERVVKEATEQGCQVYLVDTAEADSREAFFEAVRHSMPLDPPLMSARSRDALEDSLWEGLYNVESSRIVIVWSNPGPMKNAVPTEFDVAAGVLGTVADQLADETLTVGMPKDVRVFIGG
jgi:RNAse (barnase) inhibitor barstar